MGSEMCIRDRVHVVPSDRKLKEGDIVSLDLGMKYKGYHSDMAVTLPVGRVSPEAQRLIRVTKKALKRGIKKVKSSSVLMCEVFGPVFTKSHDLSCDYLPFVQAFEMLNNKITPSEWGEWMADYRLSLPAGALRVSFTETHDTRNFTPPSYGLRGSNLERAGFAALILAGFIPMIWSGQEKRNEAFYRKMFKVRRKYSIMTSGKTYFNAVESSNKWVVNVLRIFNNEILWGIVNLWPEKTTHTFSLPLTMCGIEENKEYYLYDILEEKRFSEYGKETWKGVNFKSIELTPLPFKPYFFLLKKFV